MSSGQGRMRGAALQRVLSCFARRVFQHQDSWLEREWIRKELEELIQRVLHLCARLFAVIVESTYGVSNHQDRSEREQAFVEKAREVVERGGRLLLPVVALGRAQVGRESTRKQIARMTRACCPRGFQAADTVCMSSHRRPPTHWHGRGEQGPPGFAPSCHGLSPVSCHAYSL
jgi:hypothetical protein